MEFEIEALIIFPHQLFESNADLARNKAVFLIEDALYFEQFRFHKQKIVLHRASMKAHADRLRPIAASVQYLDAPSVPTMRAALQQITPHARALHYIDPVDDWLERRLVRDAVSVGCKLARHSSPMFINDLESLRPHLDVARPSMARFYSSQRTRLDILMVDGRPQGGKWSFDSDNRRRLPPAISLPRVPVAPDNAYLDEARRYVETRYSMNPGAVGATTYPVTRADSQAWLSEFLQHRLDRFGAYEDAMSDSEPILFHSVLTPMLNIGLLSPREVIDSALEQARERDIPLNSLEGFVRQIVGWREFVRGIYEFHGRKQRSANTWGHRRPLPQSFWNASTGILPVDTVIKRVHKTGYAHHIERLMILANFMMLCEFSPDDVYRWFMEMFIDAYDWVMVPNVYGMGLHVDGGLMMTKPYISGSSYILKMSNYRRGPWCAVWDGLFWRFLAKHRAFFASHHRLRVLEQNLERMGAAKLSEHVATADSFLAQCQ